MHGQSKRMSIIESFINVFSGYFISVLIYITIMPLYGYPVTVSHSVQVTMIFSIASILRLYLLRRCFNWFLLKFSKK